MSKITVLDYSLAYFATARLRKSGLSRCNKIISESQQLKSLEQQAKDFVSKYGKIKVKLWVILIILEL